MRKNILSLIFALFCFVAAYSCIQGTPFANPYADVCEFVVSKIYYYDQEIEKWKQQCLARSQLVTSSTPKSLIIKDLSNVLQTLKMSHLQIFERQQVQSMWHGVSEDTGIESEYVDGELVVFKVHAKSSAAVAGLRYGDIIVSHNNEHPNPWRVKDTSGIFIYKRQNNESTVQIDTMKFTRQESVEIKKIGTRFWQIRVPSFRREFFETNPLEKYLADMQQASLLVIDLRGNDGGNFVAGLNFLSNFICQPQEVGRLIKPRGSLKVFTDMPQSLENSEQLSMLDKAHGLILKTFKSKNCLHAKIKVLADSKTASVAEMVAQALKELRQAEVLGSTSSGQLLVGVWYPLDELGAGVQISIPEALYESLGGRRIEGRGVELDKVLYYDLNEMQKGKDPWLEVVLKERN